MSIHRVITVQPSAHVDHITEDGRELTQLPYPFHVKADDGTVERQDFWRGSPARILGFQDRVDVQRVDLWWKDAAADPDRIVGKYIVSQDADGSMATHQLAVQAVAVTRVETPDPTVLVGGGGHWGKGVTLAEAKRNFTRYGGRLSDGYEIVTFASGTEFLGMDQMGRYHWDGPAPEVRRVNPRGRR